MEKLTVEIYAPLSHELGEMVVILQEKGIETFEKTQPDGKTKQAFFFDPDGKFS